jgi:hypothetical protein
MPYSSHYSKAAIYRGLLCKCATCREARAACALLLLLYKAAIYRGLLFKCGAERRGQPVKPKARRPRLNAVRASALGLLPVCVCVCVCVKGGGERDSICSHARTHTCYRHMHTHRYTQTHTHVPAG